MHFLQATKAKQRRTSLIVMTPLVLLPVVPPLCNPMLGMGMLAVTVPRDSNFYSEDLGAIARLLHRDCRKPFRETFVKSRPGFLLGSLENRSSHLCSTLTVGIGIFELTLGFLILYIYP